MDFTDYSTMASMALDDQEDFDYDAFLQQEEAEYMGEDSSASASTNNLGVTSPGLSPPGHGSSTGGGTSTGPSALVRSTSAVQHQQQRHERRGHTKSRRGCFNCKRRRIKVSLGWFGQP